MNDKPWHRVPGINRIDIEGEAIMDDNDIQPFTLGDIADPPGAIDLSPSQRHRELHAPIDTVTGTVRGGVLAITLAFAPVWTVEDLDGWDLMGRVTMRHNDPANKVNVVARHRVTGVLGHFSVTRPELPEPRQGYHADMPLPDLPLEIWLAEETRREALEHYARTRPLWDLVTQLPEITEVFVGTAKDLED